MHTPESGKEGYLVNGQIGQELQPNNQKRERAGNGCENAGKVIMDKSVHATKQICIFISKRQQAPTLMESLTLSIRPDALD